MSSPAVILYDAAGNPIAMRDGDSYASTQPAVPVVGRDPSGVARHLAVTADGHLSIAASAPIETLVEPYLTLIAEGDIPGHVPWVGHSKVAMASGVRTLLTEGVWNEQSTGATRSIKSTSSSDSASGTGARKVRIDYISSVDGTMKSTVVTLNGTTAVDTSVSDILFVNGMQVISSGSTHLTVGTVSLYAATGGTGAIMIQMVPGRNLTHSGSFLVPSDMTLYVVRVELSTDASKNNATSGCWYDLERTVNFSSAGGDSVQIETFFHSYSTAQSGGTDFPIPLHIDSGQRFQIYGLLDTSASVAVVGYGWMEANG